jgi:membrane associated rhomboid family serine protease
MPHVTISPVKYLFSSLYALGIYGAFMAGSIHLRTSATRSDSPPRIIFNSLPLATLQLLCVVGIPSVYQFFNPALFALFQRDYTRFMDGEWWRIGTSLLVQDGGIAGTSFNLVSLLLVGILAEQFWGSLPVLLIFLVGGIVGQFAGFAWQPVGAGNSVANFALAGSLLVACLLRRPDWPVLLIVLATVSVYILLIGLHDIHGVAAAAGMLLALVQGYFFRGDSAVQSSR